MTRVQSLKVIVSAFEWSFQDISELYYTHFATLPETLLTGCCYLLLTGLPGHPAEPKNGMEGPHGPRGFPGPVGQPGMAGIAGVPGICEARDCSIHAPVVRKEQGLVKGPLSPMI